MYLIYISSIPVFIYTSLNDILQSGLSNYGVYGDYGGYGAYGGYGGYGGGYPPQRSFYYVYLFICNVTTCN
jgi:hypothetical protein